MTWTASTWVLIFRANRSPFRDARPPVEWGNDDQRLRHVGKINRSFDRNGPGDAVIVALDRRHEHDKHRNKNHSNPGAVAELGDQDNQQGNTGGERPDAIDDHALDASGCVRPLPMDHHAGLRKCERQKSANGKQRDEPIRDPAEADQ